jgi:HAD superfamily hydrolase (TIGR01484 family)
MIGKANAPLLDAHQPAVARPRPWRDADDAVLAAVVGVMTDIDDTLTVDGALDPRARPALQALHDAGVPVVAITGRPLGWSEPFVRPGPEAWPLRAIVAENGAVALLPEAGALRVEFAQDEATRAHNARRLAEVQRRVLREVPGATAARDSAGRVTDIAIDHSEFSTLPDEAIARVVALMQAAGMTATVSSIHVNGWFGTHDKLSAARWMAQRLFGRALDGEIDRWIYVGDSTNDQTLFGAFPLSVGVANLRRFAAQLHTWPTYITEGERGAGFAEVAARLLRARGA